MAARNPDAQHVALELHPHRVRLLRKLVPNKNVEVIHSDVLEYKAEASFDRILTDVPCSGTGTLAHNPEIKWRLEPPDLLDLQSRQLAILRLLCCMYAGRPVGIFHVLAGAGRE